MRRPGHHTLPPPKRLPRPGTISQAALLVAALVLSWGVLSSAGAIRGRGIELNASAAYEARTGSWAYVWDDAVSPGAPKPPERLSWVQLLLVGLTNLTGDINVSMRLALVLLLVVALFSAYRLVLHLTGSHLAGLLAAVVYGYNGGAPYQEDLLVTAGYGLAPLVFLTLDRLLAGRRLLDVLLFALAYAAFFTVGAPSMFYVFSLVLPAYPLARWVAWGRGHRPAVALRLAGQDAARLGLAVLLVALLGGYYLAAQVVSGWGDAAGPTLAVQEAAERSITLWDAVVVDLSKEFPLGVTSAKVATLLVALVALSVILYRRSYWVTAFFVITLVSIGLSLLSGRPGSPLPAPLASHWGAVTLLGYAVLTGAAAGCTARLPPRLGGLGAYRERLRAALYLVPLLAVAVVVAGAALVHLEGTRRWLTTYQLPESYQAPFRWLASQEEAAVATTPFLATQVRDDLSLASSDYGRLLTIEVAGKVRWQGATAGSPLPGLEGGGPTGPGGGLRLHYQGPTTVQDGSVLLASGQWEHFVLDATVRLLQSSSDEGEVMLTVRNSALGLGYTVVLDQQAQEARLLRGSSPARVLDASPTTLAPGTSYRLRIAAQSPHLRVFLDGVRVLSAVEEGSPFDQVYLEAAGATAQVSDFQLTALPRVLHPEQGLMKLLGLYNARYLVLHSYTPEVEKLLFQGLQGFRPVFWQDGAFVGENDFHFPKLFVPRSLGLVAGMEVGQAVERLAQVEGFSFEKTLLLGAQESLDVGLPPPQYLILSSDGAEGMPEALDRYLQPGGPLHVYFLDPKETVIAPGTGQVVRREALSVQDRNRLLAEGPWDSFVLEATVSLGSPSGQDAYAGILFHRQSSRRYRLLRLLPEGGRLELVEVRGREVEVLGQVQVVLETDRPYELRLSVREGRVVAFLDGKLVLEGRLEAPMAGGVWASAEGLRASFTDLKAAGLEAEDDGAGYLESLGFGLGRRHDVAPVGSSPLYYPRVYVATFPVQVTASGQYRLSVRVPGPDFDSVAASLRALYAQPGAGQPHDQGLALSFSPEQSPPQVYRNYLVGEVGSYHWLTTQPFQLSPGSYVFQVQVTGRQPLVDQALLYMEPPGGTAGTPQALFDLGTPAPSVDFQKVNSTLYQASVPQGQPLGLLVFKESYHPRWEAWANGERLPHLRAFGVFNAYLLPSDPEVETLELAFTPQGLFRLALHASLASFMGVLGLAVALGVRPRLDVRQGLGRLRRTVRRAR